MPGGIFTVGTRHESIKVVREYGATDIIDYRKGGLLVPGPYVHHRNENVVSGIVMMLFFLSILLNPLDISIP